MIRGQHVGAVVVAYSDVIDRGLSTRQLRLLSPTGLFAPKITDVIDRGP